MIHLANRALAFESAGPVGATIQPKPASQQASGGKKGEQSAKSDRENRLACPARRHAVGSSAHRMPMP